MPTWPAHAIGGIAVTVLQQAGLGGPLTNEQGIIHIDSTHGGTDLGAHCASDGSDICAMLNDGTIIPLQWDNLSVSGGIVTGDCRVLLPTISTASDQQQAYLVVIPSPNTPTWTATDVWNSSYDGAFTFGDGVTIDYADKTSNGATASPHGSPVAVSYPGVGGGIYIDNLSYVNFGSNFNYTSTDFTISFWALLFVLSTNPVLLFKGPYQNSGYYLQAANDGSLFFGTNQPGAIQGSAAPAGSLALTTPYKISIIRNGASVRLFINGVDATDVFGTHIDPASSSSNCDLNTYDSGFSNTGQTAYDELTFQHVAITADEDLWHFNNVANNSSTISLGSWESATGGSSTTLLRRRRQLAAA